MGVTPTQKAFLSTKTFTHSDGLSCCFRQWRADSHCKFLHGYALKIKLVFAAPGGLDERNWVVDFGGLKDIRQWLKGMFDHKTLIAKDDPQLDYFRQMYEKKILDLVLVDDVGCEKFAELIFDYIHTNLHDDRIYIQSVEVSEHEGNSAICQRPTRIDGYLFMDLRVKPRSEGRQFLEDEGIIR